MLALTLAHIREQGLRVHLLTRRDDLDTPEDYRQLAGIEEGIPHSPAGISIRGNY